MAKVLVVLAPGFEEIETSTIVDVLRRAEIEVTLAGLDGEGPCRGSRGIVFVPDAALEGLEDRVVERARVRRVGHVTDVGQAFLDVRG